MLLCGIILKIPQHTPRLLPSHCWSWFCSIIGICLAVFLLVSLVFFLSETQYDVSEFLEQWTCQRLSEEITDHILGRTIMDFQFLALHSVGNKDVPDVDVAGTFDARHFPIVNEFDARLVILINNFPFAHDVIINSHTLLRKKST